ncbi:hypothetical protein QUB05_17110 [Microcoleus sp. F10-C6]|uniref:hypothetical protein n=1 Tax=unclassified Microcoleus TaxID=2642155 RepID=UPI002FD1E249
MSDRAIVSATLLPMGASQFCSQARNWSFEARGCGARGCEEEGRRKEEEGRSQKKYFYKYEMLPCRSPCNPSSTVGYHSHLAPFSRRGSATSEARDEFSRFTGRKACS